MTFMLAALEVFKNKYSHRKKIIYIYNLKSNFNYENYHVNAILLHMSVAIHRGKKV